MSAAAQSTVMSTETTPLLPAGAPKYAKSILYRTLFCGFMVSLSFGVTQVPLIYVFRLMTCEAYYTTHPFPSPPLPDNCNLPAIQALTARSVALLGSSTTLFGVLNLFLTSYSIKRLGIKSALLTSVFFPAVRLAIQNVGVQIGGERGIMVIQCSQIITILGGPAGYVLALNSYVAEVVGAEGRTGALGMLQGCTFFGTATAYLLGGWMSDALGILAPFRVTVVLFLGSCCYVMVALPWLVPAEIKVDEEKKGLKRILGPLTMFTPQKWMTESGKVYVEYGVLLLGIGVFLGVLSTGYQSVLLQMYATDAYDFGTTENGYLIALNTFVQGVFLTAVFPRTIAAGRRWFKKGDEKRAQLANGAETSEQSEGSAEVQSASIQEESTISTPSQEEGRETFAFDLLYCRYSLLVDSIVTASAATITRGWQMYLIAAILPFASGTGASAKGSMLQMCHISERVDALGAITLVEMLARLTTTTIFGFIFAAFAERGVIYMVFLCNAGVAFLGFCVLIFSRFPREGSERLQVAGKKR